MYNDFAAHSQPHFDVKRAIPEKGQVVKTAVVPQDVYGSPESTLEKVVLTLVAFGPMLLLPFALFYGVLAGNFVWWIDIPAFLIFNYWRGLGVTLSYHRNLTHGNAQDKIGDDKESFVLAPGPRLFWLIGGHLAIQTDGQDWGRIHRRHHSDSDGPEDPHSPWRYVDDDSLKPGMPGYRLALLKGIWWAHFGWMNRSWKVDERFYYGFDKDEQLQWCRRHYFKLVVFSYGAPFVLGAMLKLILVANGSWSWGMFGWGVLYTGLCAGILNIWFVHHVTWCINSLCHVFGVRPFKKVGSDRSTDLPFWEYGPLGKLIALTFAFVSNGEAYHAGHHAFSNSPKHALAWRYHVDMTWFVIKAHAALGLARIGDVPSRETIRRRLMPEWAAVSRL